MLLDPETSTLVSRLKQLPGLASRNFTVLHVVVLEIGKLFHPKSLRAWVASPLRENRLI
jgi:hypothetical protein